MGMSRSARRSRGEDFDELRIEGEGSRGTTYGL